MVEFPAKREREYIAAIGIAAVFVAEGRVVRASRDLEASARELGLTIISAWWLKDRDTAAAVARAVSSRQPSDAADAEAEIAAEAARHGLRMAAHAAVLERAAVVAPRVDAALRAANRRGELTWFNRAFRARRQQGSRVNFGTAWEWLRRAVVRQLVLTGRVEYGPDMLADVFGELSTAK